MPAPLSRRKIWLKRVLSLLLLGVFAYFFWPILQEVRSIGGLLHSARWEWLLGALALQLLSYGFLTWLNALALRPFSGRIGFFRLAAVLTAMAFIQIALPSAGASGAALRVRLLGKYGYRAEEALFSLVIETLAEVVMLVAVSWLGVMYLLQSDQLSRAEVGWMLVLGVAGFLLTWMFFRRLVDRRHSQRMLVKWTGIWNRLVGRLYRLPLERLEQRLADFQINLARYRQVPFPYFALAAAGKVILDVATLGAGFFLVNHAISPGKLFTGYGLILTFSGLAALPAGLGMADASVPVIFTWLEVPAAVALAAGLVYRLIAFWLLRLVGFFCWQYLEERA
jgi:uncharacterized protein (TIRG00374 family)